LSRIGQHRRCLHLELAESASRNGELLNVDVPSRLPFLGDLPCFLSEELPSDELSWK
jgi:hypothetical protein